MIPDVVRSSEAGPPGRVATGSPGPAILAMIWLPVALAVLYAWPLGFDEFEHMHAAWLLAQGDTPYLDFVEEHNPLQWFLLRPLLWLWPHDASILYPARGMTFLLLLLAGATLAAITREVFDRRTAYWAALIWLFSMPVLVYGFQSRPDTSMTLMLLLSVWAIVRWARCETDTLLVASGAAWGVAFLFLQKAVLFVPVLGLVVLLRGRSVDRLVRHSALWTAGCGAPLALGAAWLWSRGALAAWAQWGFLFSRTTPSTPPGSRTLGFSLGFYPLLDVATETGTVATLLAIAGAVRLLRARIEKRDDPAHRLALTLALGGTLLLIASLAIPRRPSPWYLIPLLALAAVLAAHGVDWCLSAVRSRRPSLGTPAAIALALLIGLQPLAWLSSRTHLMDDAAIQMRREAFARCITDEDEVVFQGGEEFNLFLRDASFFWYVPFEKSRRAGTLGLRTMRPFERLVTEEAPAVISLFPYLEREHERFLEEAGYRYEPVVELYYRPNDRSEGSNCLR